MVKCYISYNIHKMTMEILMTQLLSTRKTVCPRKAWIKAQCKTNHHKMALLLYALICATAVFKVQLAFWGPFIFFIITALTKLEGILCSMLFSLLITTIASLINPILGVIVSILFLLMKLSSFISNWRALLAGVFIYLLPTFLVNRLGYFLIYGTPIHKVLLGFNLSAQITSLMIFFIIGGFSGMILHLTLKWLYKNKYSSKSALATMGAAPLIILLMILPFIIHAVGEIIDDIVSSTGHPVGDDFIAFKENFDSTDLDGDGINDYTHSVRGHYRSTPNGGVTYVEPHIRTNPNGIIQDNISYHR